MTRLWQHTVRQDFTGLDLDPLTGQYYAPYRYYDPGITRWLTRDPLGMVDGPNVYGYVKYGPTVGRDPLGLFNWRLALCKAFCFAGYVAGLALLAELFVAMLFYCVTWGPGFWVCLGFAISIIIFLFNILLGWYRDCKADCERRYGDGEDSAFTSGCPG